MMISWWSKHVGVILSVLMCDICINVLLQNKCISWTIIYSELKCTVKQWNKFENVLKYYFTCSLLKINKFELLSQHAEPFCLRKSSGSVTDRRVVTKCDDGEFDRKLSIHFNCHLGRTILTTILYYDRRAFLMHEHSQTCSVPTPSHPCCQL
jgi:hypothetical protein